MSNTLPTAEHISQDWKTNPRWAGIERNYSAEDVVRLRGTIGVGCDLPAAQINRLEAGLDLLHGLVAGQRTERVDEIFFM